MKTKVKDFDYYLGRMMHFCAYQERCSSEVHAKLENFDISINDKEQILNILSKEKYLDDERFVKLYAYSKNKHNNWGKIKISAKLREMKISDKLIAIGLCEIDDKMYAKQVYSLAKSKILALKNRRINASSIKLKVQRYLVSKGFEYDLIKQVLNKRFKY